MGREDHGKISTYNNYKCRCTACKLAYTEYRRKLRARLTPEERKAEARKRKANRVYKSNKNSA